MQILNLEREFEMMGMKRNKMVKEYWSRLVFIIKQIKLLSGEFSIHRIVNKPLVTLLECYETKRNLKILKISQNYQF